MKKHIKKTLFTLISIILIILLFLLIHYKFVFVRQTNSNPKIGIIDTELSREHSNLVYSSDKLNLNNNSMHGDKMIEFATKCQHNLNIYYFNLNYDSKPINSEKIIEGLEWMYQNNVKKINISLSSKHINATLEEWLKHHTDILVFASYNNKLNSYDYPAMYNEVIGSGSDKRIPYKTKDFKYSSSNIIIINHGIQFYGGNSFLSILSMLKYNQ